eukprot:UN31097
MNQVPNKRDPTIGNFNNQNSPQQNRGFNNMTVYTTNDATFFTMNQNNMNQSIVTSVPKQPSSDAQTSNDSNVISSQMLANLNDGDNDNVISQEMLAELGSQGTQQSPAQDPNVMTITQEMLNSTDTTNTGNININNAGPAQNNNNPPLMMNNNLQQQPPVVQQPMTNIQQPQGVQPNNMNNSPQGQNMNNSPQNQQNMNNMGQNYNNNGYQNNNNFNQNNQNNNSYNQNNNMNNQRGNNNYNNNYN